MRPYQTIILLVLIAAAVVYFRLRQEPEDPRIEGFVSCYVELALLHELADTATVAYRQQRDSLLTEFGFTEESLLQLKADFDRDPQGLIDIWSRIDERLKARKVELDPKE